MRIDLTALHVHSFNRSIPPPAESRPARLQLMLYHRILSSMLGPEPPPQSPPPECPLPAGERDLEPAPALSWSNLFAHLSLSPSAPLSKDFLESVAPVIADSGILPELQHATTLEQFVQVLRSYGELLRGGRDAVLLNELEIVYRLRHENGRAYANRRGKRRTRDKTADAELPARKSAAPRELMASTAMDVEGTNLQLAIAVSLSHTPGAESTVMGKTSAKQEVSPAGSEAAQSDVDSQPEDSQLPFFANPSLPIPFPSSPSRGESHDDCATPSLPGSAFALPNNSPAAATSMVDDPCRGEAVMPPRYDLRRRSERSATTELGPGPLPPVQPTPQAQVTQTLPLSPQTPVRHHTTTADKSDLIGVDSFKNSPSELDIWLRSVLAYWNGRRPPEGVKLAQVNRCRCATNFVHCRAAHAHRADLDVSMQEL